jgi:hypothetical protein
MKQPYLYHLNTVFYIQHTHNSIHLLNYLQMEYSYQQMYSTLNMKLKKNKYLNQGI